MHNAPGVNCHYRPDGGRSEEPCDDCGQPVADALTRIVEMRVDGAQLHSHRLCPDCFAAWVDRYDRQLSPDRGANADSEIIVD